MKHGSSKRLSGVSTKATGRRELRAQGERTRSIIVRAATKLLLEHGSLDFTLRAVARQAKISVSNLQYYFPSRDALLRAVIAPVIDGYLADLDRAVSGSLPPREALYGLFERQMRDIGDSRARNLWCHFAALASIDPECARLIDEWYDALVRGVAQLVTRINPQSEPLGSLQLASVLIAMGDGLGYQMLGQRNHNYTRDYEANFRANFDFLLQRSPLLKAPVR